MTILKKGTLPQDKRYRATCRTCKTEVEFAQIEAERRHDMRDGDALVVKCPVCNGEIWTTP